MTVEKSPLQSKKFVAFMTVTISFGLLTLVGLVAAMMEPSKVMFFVGFAALVQLINGFVSTGYLLGQASLDKYVRMAKIAADAGQKITLKSKGLDIGGHDGEKRKETERQAAEDG